MIIYLKINTMKKIIFLLLIPILLIGCEKQEIVKPECNTEYNNLNIELYGGFQGYFVHNGGYDFDYFDIEVINYTINLNINGLDHFINIEKTMNAGFVGIVYDKQLRLNANDNLKISVLNNTSNHSLIYLRLYTNINRKKVIELDNYYETKIKISDNYFNDVEIEWTNLGPKKQ